jgi:hypothetical protein
MESEAAKARSLRLSGATRKDRLACTASIRDVIVAECHGWIGDFYQYSNLSLCIHFEIPVSNLSVLRDSLGKAGVALGRDAEDAFRKVSDSREDSETISCTLQITFIHDVPDLRRHIPAVPG